MHVRVLTNLHITNSIYTKNTSEASEEKPQDMTRYVLSDTPWTLVPGCMGPLHLKKNRPPIPQFLVVKGDKTKGQICATLYLEGV